jgi:putative phage-type endonuclease
MRLINLKPNTPEWLEERRRGLGASDAPIVMGVSPYKTRRQLWESKLGLRADEGESFITELGHKFEPMARAQFSIETNIDLVEAFAVHDEFEYLRASLDGLNERARLCRNQNGWGEKVRTNQGQ